MKALLDPRGLAKQPLPGTSNTRVTQQFLQRLTRQPVSMAQQHTLTRLIPSAAAAAAATAAVSPAAAATAAAAVTAAAITVSAGAIHGLALLAIPCLTPATAAAAATTAGAAAATAGAAAVR